MIGFAVPWIFGVALVASLAISALHFLSVRQPRVMLLPTARFVPERDARAVARQAKPSDVPLLLLRLLALLAAGAALAGARCGARGARVSSIVVMDRAKRADSSALMSRVAAAAPVDDAASATPPTVLWVNGVSDDPGVAIAAAIREAARSAQANPSLAKLSLTVLIPESVRSRSAWDAWRGQWPASIRVVAADAATASDTGAGERATPELLRVVSAGAAARSFPASDVVEAAFALRGALASPGRPSEAADVVVFRASADGVDGAGVPDAGVTVQWPVSGVPVGWRAAPPLDSVSAVSAAGIALVAPWLRTALPPAMSPAFPDSVRAIAWWSDGVPAAIERTRGTSCVREVAIAVADGSDLLLSPAADGLLRVLRAPCGGRGVPAPREPAGGADMTSGTGSGTAASTAYVPASQFRAGGATTGATQPAWLATALLVVAFVALLAEHLVRRESTGPAAS